MALPARGARRDNGAVPVLFALLAAFSNALNVVTQHVASIGDPGHSKGWRFVRYLVSNPLWLFGWVALAGAFVFQALALHNGQMSVVQPLLVTELVFALVLRWLWIHQSIRAVTWWAAALTCVSLALFVAMAEPTRRQRPADQRGLGRRPPRPPAGAAALLALLGLRGSPGRRAALLGASTSMLWALVATFIKATTDTLTQFGVVGHVHPLAGLRAGRHRSRGRAPEPGRPPRRARSASRSRSSSSSTRS